jgi:hypothetical protein
MADKKISELPLVTTPLITDEIPVTEGGTTVKTTQAHMLRNGVLTGTTAAMPAAGTEGLLYCPTDGHYVYRDDGAAWQAFGPICPMTLPPPLGSWTWVNQDNTVADDSSGAISLYGTGTQGGQDWRCLVMAAPATPYSITMYFKTLYHWDANRNPSDGFIWRNSGSGNLVIHHSYMASNVWRVQGLRNNSPTSNSGQYYDTWTPSSPDAGTWWRVRDDGTTRYLDAGSDGRIWSNVTSNTHTDFITPDQVGFTYNPYGYGLATPGGITLYHWKITNSAAF